MHNRPIKGEVMHDRNETPALNALLGGRTTQQEREMLAQFRAAMSPTDTHLPRVKAVEDLPRVGASLVEVPDPYTVGK